MKVLSIEGYEHYLIGENGEVFNTKLNKKILPYNNGLGYLAVKLRNSEGKRYQFYVHRLVALTYLNSSDLSDVNHKDCDKLNNHYSNLEWSTRSNNLKHAFKNKLLKGFVSKFYKIAT